MEEATMGMMYSAFRDQSGDDALLVKFYLEAVTDEPASKLAGHPVFKDMEFINIRTPGNKLSSVARPARAKDRERFPRHYAAFKNRIEDPEIGMPLSQWAAIGKSDCENLLYMNIKTVEQLAASPDSAGDKILGFHKFKEMANAFLEQSAINADANVITELRDQNQLLMDRLAALEASMPAAEPEEVAEEE